MSIEAKLSEMKLGLPKPSRPVAAYLPAVRSGNLVFVSGQLPMTGGQLLAKGKVPTAVPLDQAHQAAVQCTLNGLSVLKEEVGGDWAKVARVVRLGVFVQSEPTFADQHLVANGASELLVALFGESGKHARAAVGVPSLPMNASVEIDFVFELQE